MAILLFCAFYLLLCNNLMAQKIVPNRDYYEIKRFNAYYAWQGVAVDKHHFYAIDNNHISKFTLDGDSVTTWYESNKNKICHINSGFVQGGKLYCAHSNYPQVPMASSIEVFDTKSMKHVETVSLGIDVGSCVWITPGKKCRYVFFAHYADIGSEKGKDVSWSQLVQYDKKWRRMQAWVLPKELVKEITPSSLSSGILIDNIFYCMGHDHRKCYLLKLPKYGMQLDWIGTINVPIPGQAIAIDGNGDMWGIDRNNRQVIKASQN